jgi:hypothetical protein
MQEIRAGLISQEEKDEWKFGNKYFEVYVVSLLYKSN